MKKETKVGEEKAKANELQTSATEEVCAPKKDKKEKTKSAPKATPPAGGKTAFLVLK